MITARKGLFFVALVLLACALLNQQWTRWFTGRLNWTVDTVQRPAQWVASLIKVDPAVDEPDMDQDKLREQLRDVKKYNAELWTENAELRKQIEAFKAIALIQDIQAIRPVQAQVGSFNGDKTNPTMKLLRGAMHGIKRDDAVAYKQNLIGFVQEVGPVTCTVRLITSPDFRSEVMIMPPDLTRAQNNWPYIDWVESDDKGGFYFDVASSIAQSLRPGDVVRVRDTLRKSANGFMLGQIRVIDKHPTNPTQESRVFISPSVPIGPQSEATVITQRTD